MYTRGRRSETGWCPRCGLTVAVRPRLHHGGYLTLCFFTCGLGLPIWLVDAVRASRWRCYVCRGTGLAVGIHAVRRIQAAARARARAMHLRTLGSIEARRVAEYEPNAVEGR